MWIGANNDQIWLSMGYMWLSDSEQCSNRLELDIISYLVNFTCELGQIMTRYDFLWLDGWFWAMFSNRLDLISHLVNFFRIIVVWLPIDQTSDSGWTISNFLCEMRQIMTRYDFLLHRQVILSNIRLNLILLINSNLTCGKNRWIFWEKSPKWG